MFGALRSLASTLMQPVGQPFGQAPSQLRAVGLPAGPAPPPAGDPVPLIVRSRRGFFLPLPSSQKRPT